MKRIAGLALSLGLVGCLAGAPSVAAGWAKSYTPPLAATQATIKQAADGDFVIVGTFRAPQIAFGQYDGLIVRLAPDGAVRWSKRLATASNSNAEELKDFVLTADGGYAMAGSSHLDSTNPRAWIMKLDASGNFLWQKEFGTGSVRLSAIVQTDDDNDGVADDGYIVIGEVLNATRHALVAKLDSSGGMSWVKLFGLGTSTSGKSIVQTSDGGFAFAASTFADSTRTGYFIVKLDAAGNSQWQRRLVPVAAGDGFNANPYSIWQTADQGLIVAGSADFDSTSLFRLDGWVVKLTASGDVDWQRQFTGSTDDGLILRAAPTADGGLVATGQYATDFVLLRLDAAGGTVLQRTYGGISSDSGKSVVETSAGGYALAGIIAGSFSVSQNSIWALSLDVTGDISFQSGNNGKMTTPAITSLIPNVPAEVIQSGASDEPTASTVTNAVSTDVTLTVRTQSQ